MEKCVIFAGGSSPYFEPDKVRGYLIALIDYKILREPIKEGYIHASYESGEPSFWFPKDTKLEQILQELSPKLPQSYTVFRAEVADEIRLKKIAPRMCEHFNLEYRIYEAELRDVF